MKAKKTLLLAASLGAALLSAGAVRAADDWLSGSKHFSPDQAKVLLQFSRDLYVHKDLPDAEYTRCLAPVDAAASEESAKEEWGEAFKMIDGAARRLGHNSYLEFADPEERVRTAKQLADGAWLKQFKNKFRSCLYTPEVKGALKMH